MVTTKDQLRTWFNRGVDMDATHMIVVCDTFDYGDYPVFVSPDEDARERASEFDGKNMQRIMEVYDLRMDREEQMAERCAFHY